MEHVGRYYRGETTKIEKELDRQSSRVSDNAVQVTIIDFRMKSKESDGRNI